MKNYLILICLLTLLACNDNSDPIDDSQVTSASIKGSWNLEEYIDIDGAKHRTTYSIFVWYEQGFEFNGKNSFHPRYDPELRFSADGWETDYLVGPGTYVVSGGILTLSYNDQIYDYKIKRKDDNTIILSNESPGQNPWTGTWILTKDN